MSVIKNSSKYTQILPDAEIAEALGEFIAVWSMIDLTFSLLLMELMSLGFHRTVAETATDKTSQNPYNNILILLRSTALLPTLGMESRVKIGIIKTLLGSRIEKKFIKEAEKLLDKVMAIKNSRDFLAHCLWMKNKETGRVYAWGIKTVGGLKERSVHVTPKYIKCLVETLDKRIHKLFEYLHEHDMQKSLSFENVHSGFSASPPK